MEQLKLDKTLSGIVKSLDDVFEGFGYVLHTPLPKSSGNPRSVTRYPKDYYFCWSRDTRIQTRMDQYKGVLCVKPKPNVRRYVESRSMKGEIGSFELIPWEKDGVMLVIAKDSTMIASPWIAFVPLDAIPEINPNNTPIVERTS